MPDQKRSLLSSQARIQAPWIKVVIGEYTFGVFVKEPLGVGKNAADFYSAYKIQFPNYVQRLSIIKINGQVNQYTLSIAYPVRPGDDPNFFEKVFGSVSKTRKIVFSYGDSTQPSYVYKDEEALITGITQQFDLTNCKILYTVKAVSSAILGKAGNFTFINSEPKKPSTEIKNIFRNRKYGLQNIFTGMNASNIDALIASDDKVVKLESKTNISPLDYLLYLVGCMIPAGSTNKTLSQDIYILTIHDDTIYDKLYNDTLVLTGPYFKVTKTPSHIERADAYEVDIGFNTSTIVTSFTVEKNENYSILYDYTEKLSPEQYTYKLDDDGKLQSIYAPMYTSGNNQHQAKPDDAVWFTKMTKFPINATLKINGLLRPATLMQFLRLNVVFPGGNKHISSGLYIVTKQIDDISESGYTTTLSITRVSD